MTYKVIHHDWYSKEARLLAAPDAILQPSLDHGACYEIRIGDQTVRIYIDPDYADDPKVHIIY